MTGHPQKHQTAIEVLEEKIDSLNDDLVEAKDKIATLERDQTWTAHLDWPKQDEDEPPLPVPRIEIRVECFGPDDQDRVDEVHATQYLIMPHHGGWLEAIPLAQSRRVGTWPTVADAVYDPIDVHHGRDPRIETYGQATQAWHNAVSLKVPLYVAAHNGERELVRQITDIGHGYTQVEVTQ